MSSHQQKKLDQEALRSFGHEIRPILAGKADGLAVIVVQLAFKLLRDDAVDHRGSLTVPLEPRNVRNDPAVFLHVGIPPGE